MTHCDNGGTCGQSPPPWLRWCACQCGMCSDRLTGAPEAPGSAMIPRDEPGSYERWEWEQRQDRMEDPWARD